MRRMSILLTSLLVALGAAAGSPDRESLLAAWEVGLRSDPETVRLEAQGEGRYAFATRAFPFDGTLEITEVVIDDRGAEGPFGALTGHVVVDLVDLDDELRRRHAMSLGLWEAGNTFMWDADEGRWLTAAEWSGRIQREYGGLWNAVSSGLFWIVLLAAIAVAFWLFTRRAGRQMTEAMAQQRHALEQQERAMRMHEEGLELAREGNRLLASILRRLEGRDDG